MEPFSTKFNIACQHIANKLWPLGFDVSGVDTDIPAPDSLDNLNALIATRGRLVVDGSNSENTIFACAETNYCFRAWHDWCHWKGQHEFTLEGETRVAEMQIEHVRKLYGHRDAREFTRLIWEEVVGQATWHAVNGRFPTDQRLFARQYLNGTLSYPTN